MWRGDDFYHVQSVCDLVCPVCVAPFFSWSNALQNSCHLFTYVGKCVLCSCWWCHEQHSRFIVRRRKWLECQKIVYDICVFHTLLSCRCHHGRVYTPLGFRLISTIGRNISNQFFFMLSCAGLFVISNISLIFFFLLLLLCTKDSRIAQGAWYFVVCCLFYFRINALWVPYTLQTVSNKAFSEMPLFHICVYRRRQIQEGKISINHTFNG